MAALKIEWKTVEHVAKADAVVTGEAAEEGEEASPFAGLDKPLVVLVADPTAALADFEKLEEVVFKNEKIGLAMKAFHAMRISPEHAAADPILQEKGKGVPRLLIVDPVKERVKVLEEKKIKVSALYKLMKSVSGAFYKEKLDKLVKEHLKILNEYDKLYKERQNLQDKETRLAEEESAKAKKDIEKVREEVADVEKEIEDLKTQESDLWKLTPKKA